MKLLGKLNLFKLCLDFYIIMSISILEGCGCAAETIKTTKTIKNKNYSLSHNQTDSKNYNTNTNTYNDSELLSLNTKRSSNLTYLQTSDSDIAEFKLRDLNEYII